MSLLELPTQLFSYFGEFLELSDIRALALTNKTILQKIEKEKIYHHYLKKRFDLFSLPGEWKSWKEIAKQIIEIKWGKCSETFIISENRKRIELKNGKSSCALTNLSFTNGRHLITILIQNGQVGFYGIALETTPLETHCCGLDCFGYSPYYQSYRQIS